MGAHACIAVQGPSAPNAVVDVFLEEGAAGQAYEAQAGACMPADTPPSSHACHASVYPKSCYHAMPIFERLFRCCPWLPAMPIAN